MKKILTVIISIGFYSTLLSQNINQTKSELDSILCNKKWVVNSFLLQGIKINQLPDSYKNTYTFNLNGNSSITYNSGDVKKGNWKYNKGSKKIVLNYGDKISFIIKSIDQEILTLDIGIQEDSKNNLLRGIELYLKPISN